MSRQNSIGVHLFELGPAIVDSLPGHDLEPFGLSNRVWAAVGLNVTDNNVDTLRFQPLGLLKHPVGLADTGGVAHEDLEFPALFSRNGHGGKSRTSMPRESRISAVKSICPTCSSSIFSPSATRASTWSR